MKSLIRFFHNLTDLHIFLIIFSIGFIIYFNSLTNGFVGDDLALILVNPLVHSASNIPILFSTGLFPDQGSGQNNYYRPVETITYASIYSLFGPEPLAFHIIQIFLHIANSILIFLIFKLFFKKTMSFFLSLVFLVHPINTETVVYISVLQDTQFLFFGLIALYLTIKSTSFYKVPLVTIFLLLSLLSKEAGIVFIFLVPFFSVLFQKQTWVRHLAQSILAVLIYSFLRFGVAHTFFNSLKVVPIQTLPFNERLISIPKIIFFYIKTFLFPKDLLIFQAWTIKSMGFLDFWVPLFLCVLSFVILLLFGLKIRKKNQELFKIFMFFSVWFVIGLGFHLQIIPIDQTVSDRYFYSPMIGLLGLTGTTFNYFEKGLSLKQIRLMIIMALVVIAIFVVRVVIRNMDWKNEFTLYNHDLKFNRESWQLEDALGSAYFNARELDEAEKHYLRSIKLFPSSVTLTDLGFFYMYIHRINNAKAAYQNALKYGDLYRTYHYLGLLLSANDEPVIAKEFIEGSLDKFPKAYALWKFLAIDKYKLGDREGAIDAAKKAYSLSASKENYEILEAIENGKEVTIQKF